MSIAGSLGAVRGRLFGARREATLKGGYVVLHAVIEPDGGQFTARCNELDVTTCGETVQEAVANVQDAVLLYLQTLQEDGDLANELEARGLEVVDRAPEAVSLRDEVRPGSFVTPFSAPVAASELALA